MLPSALKENAEQRKITASAVLAARKRRSRGNTAVAEVIAQHQLESIVLSVGSTVDQLADQDIDAPPAATMSASSLVTPEFGAVALLEKTKTKTGFDRLVASMVIQSSLTAAAVDMMRRPKVTHYVRTLTPPSCGRCAVLAGKVFSWQADFDRHPKCDCTALLTDDNRASDLVTDPLAAYRNGDVTGLTQADIYALDHGADFNQVVNVRAQSAGLRSGSSVMVRRVPAYYLNGERFVWDRLTPEAIRRISTTREEAIQRLADNGYVRGVRDKLSGAHPIGA